MERRMEGTELEEEEEEEELPLPQGRKVGV